MKLAFSLDTNVTSLLMTAKSESPYKECLIADQYEPLKMNLKNNDPILQNQYQYPAQCQYTDQQINKNYVNQQPGSEAQHNSCSGSLCGLVLISILCPIAGWVFACVLQDPKPRKICPIAATVSFVVNLGISLGLYFYTLSYYESLVKI